MGTVAKKTERTMPITVRILPPRRPAASLLLLLACTFLGVVAAPAAGRADGFTLVTGGKIVTVDVLPGTPRHVSGQAIVELVRAAPGRSLAVEPGTGVLSITADGGTVAPRLEGFPARTTQMTVVVGGKIATSPVRVSKGVPYLPVRSLKVIAERIGFAAELDEKAGVMALTPPTAVAGGGTAGGGASAGAAAGATPRPSWGLNGTFMESVSSGAAGGPATGFSGGRGGGDVCGYMDRMKTLWVSTEPSYEEKETLKQLANLFQAQAKSKAQGNPADIKRLEAVLRSFDGKLQRRLGGTAGATAPAGAEAWHGASVEFLEKVDQVMRISFDLIRVMKLPKDEALKEGDKPKQNVDRLKRLNAEVQSIGTRQVQETHAVRAAHGCSPP